MPIGLASDDVTKLSNTWQRGKLVLNKGSTPYKSMLGEKSLTWRSSLFLCREVRAVLTTGAFGAFAFGAFAIFSVSAEASLPISLPPFLSSFFLFLFLSFPLPFPSTCRLRFKFSFFALIPLITILSGRARCTMATVTGSPSEAGLVCGHWIMPML